MDALEASNFALTTGVLTGSLPGVNGTWQVEFRDSAPSSTTTRSTTWAQTPPPR